MAGASFVRQDPPNIGALAKDTDSALVEVDQVAKRGFINIGRLDNPSRSYLFEEDGVLKFYSKSTGIVSTISTV